MLSRRTWNQTPCFLPNQRLIFFHSRRPPINPILRLHCLLVSLWIWLIYQICITTIFSITTQRPSKSSRSAWVSRSRSRHSAFQHPFILKYRPWQGRRQRRLYWRRSTSHTRKIRLKYFCRSNLHTSKFLKIKDVCPQVVFQIRHKSAKLGSWIKFQHCISNMKPNFTSKWMEVHCFPFLK